MIVSESDHREPEMASFFAVTTRRWMRQTTAAES